VQAGNMDTKAALITGAADYLGRATAIRLAQAGANMCLVDGPGDGLEETASLARELGVQALTIPVDIGTREACVAAVADAVERFGRLDVLCNIDNVFRPSRSLSATQLDWERTLAINLSAPFYLIQAALPHLIKVGGAVINVLSPVAVSVHPLTAAYTASKAGLAQLTRSLAKEFISDNVRINAVLFGGAPMGRRASAGIPADLDPKLFQKSPSARSPIAIESVADAIAFLASDAAAGFHGSVVSLDNGISLG
jgi:NAD(P)-dependent dehydrogenase (short-subunit alcohol dehydrogenase family)